MPESDFDIRKIVRRERHAVVFDWLCQSLGKTPEQLASEMLTNSIMREAAAYREAKGGGGQSGKNLEAVAARLR